MANVRTISSLGPGALTGSPARTHEQAVKEMEAFWRSQVEQVLPDHPDLIVVPEACDRYPNYSREQLIDYYHYRGDRIRDFFAGLARDNGCCIAYSASREMEDGTRRNSTQIIDREGKVAGIYNKNHVVVEETTRFGILCGKEAEIIPTDIGRLACAICFDLNFAPLREKYVPQQPDLIVFCSMYHGGLMQNYWAYSCRSHFVGAICNDQCTVISPLGELIACSTNYTRYVTATVNLDTVLAHLDYNRARFTALKKAYGKGVTITDPGHLGCVMITSNVDGRSAREMAAEFEVELLDDYWTRALNHHRESREP